MKGAERTSQERGEVVGVARSPQVKEPEKEPSSSGWAGRSKSVSLPAMTSIGTLTGERLVVGGPNSISNSATSAAEE